METEEPLRLIVLDDSSNITESITSILRNAGHVARAKRIEDDEDLREAIREQDWDILLAKPEIPYFTAMDALGFIAQMDEELPLIVIADNVEEIKLLEMLNAGARDTVLLSKPERLIHTVLREHEDAKARSKHRICARSLQETIERAQSLVDSSRDAIAYVHDGMHIYANESYLEIFGYSDLDEIEGMPIMNMVSKQEHEKFKKYLRDYIKGKAIASSLDVHGLHAEGKEMDITLEFSPAHYEGEPCTQIIIRTQTTEGIDTSRDLLTGLYNRQYFLDKLGSAVSAGNQQGAVLFIALDNYEKIRGDMGITASDRLLADFAALLQEQLTNEKDILASFESNRFTAILIDVDPAAAEKAAQSLLTTTSDHIFDAGGQSATTTCSIGIGVFNETMQQPQEVLNRAEKAALSAFSSGGNKVEVYQPDAREMADIERVSILARKVKNALKQNTFKLLFQPIASLKGETSEQYEVLLRLYDEEGNEYSPKEFIPAAEQSGLMVAIDRWVLAHTVKAAATESRNGKTINFFVKISGDSLKDPKFLPWLRDLLKAANIMAGTLIVEVSEKVAQSNLKSLKMFIEGLQQLRVRLALDHFGIAENYQNLLKHCNADFLKIDASLIQSVTTTSLDKVKDIAAHAKDSGKECVAVAVEDPNTLAMIYATGMEYIQGYFLQAPSEKLNFDFNSSV